MLQNSYIGVDIAKPKIIALTKKTAESQFEIGVILKELKDKVETFKEGDWKKKESPFQVAQFEYKNLIENELPFGKVVANKLIQIGSDSGIKTHLNDIPFAYNTMYDLVGMSEDQWNFYFESGLTTKSTAKDIAEMKKKWLEKTQPKTDETVQDEQEESDTVEYFGKLVNEKVNDKFADLKVGDPTSTEHIHLTIEMGKLTAFEKSKVQDLISFIEKLNFSEEKGVSYIGMNPDILSDAPPKKMVA